MSIVSDRALPRRRPRHWKHPGVLIGIAVLVLAGTGFGVNDAIERYHDRIALRGLNGKPSPVSLIVAGEPMVIPANMIRFRAERRGGPVDQVDLIFQWPSLDGFSDERADDFRDPSPTAPLIYVTISARENSLDSSARIDSIYARFFEGPEIPGPARARRPGAQGRVGLRRRDRLLRAARREPVRRPLPGRSDGTTSRRPASATSTPARGCRCSTGSTRRT